jgi:transposase-like protein
MNSDQHFVVVMVTIVAVAGTISLLVRTLASAWRDRSRRTLPQGPSDERLARLEQAVDAIAIEVERMSEGQRFVAKLLAERAEAERANRPAERVKTPV